MRPWLTDKSRKSTVSDGHKKTMEVKQTCRVSPAKVIFPLAHQGEIMEKTRNKAKQFFKLDKLGQRIMHIARSIAKERKERAEKSFERRMMLN